MKKLFTLMVLLMAFVAANATSVSISGSFTEWGNGTAMKEEVEGTKYVLDFDLSANESKTLEFKVIIDGGWYGGSLTLDTKAEVGASGNNFTFTNSFKKYKFVVEKEGEKWYVTVTGSEERGALVTQIYLAGTMNEWSETNADYKFTVVEDEKEYTLDWDATAFEAVSYTFKIVIGGSWFGAVDSSSSTIVFDESTNGSFSAMGPNFTLTNTYKKYNFKVVNDGDSWKLTVTGSEERKSGESQNIYTVSFDNAGNWGEVWAYTWTQNESGEAVATELGNWPGTKMTQTDGGYTIDIKADAAPQFIIFNNGLDGDAAAQTDNLAFVDGKAYTYTQTYTVTFKFEEGAVVWNKVYAWANGYRSGEVFGAWPGTEMTLKDGVYSISFEGTRGPETIVFNSGLSSSVKYVDQTGDLFFVNGMEYSYAPCTVFSVAGEEALTGYAWDATKNDMTRGTEEYNSGTWSITFEGVQLAEALRFKVVGNHNWAVSWPQEDVIIDPANFEGTGTYTIVITFQPNTDAIDITPARTGELTAIRTIDSVANSATAIYTLQGVRVDKVQKGLYIVNGRKVIIR